MSKVVHLHEKVIELRLAQIHQKLPLAEKVIDLALEAIHDLNERVKTLEEGQWT